MRCQMKTRDTELSTEKGKEYKQKKKQKIMIQRAKEETQNRVCEEVDRNVWGEGCKIVTKWMGRGMKGSECGGNVTEEARKLFPRARFS